MPDIENEILGIKHLNGGLSYVCPKTGQIIIYRKEEWFKVFIHESFHNLGFDFANMHLSEFNKKFQSIFQINSEFNIYEAYCEFWALTLNIIIVSFVNLQKSHDINTFINNFKFYMSIEQCFTYIQVNKVLNYMGLKYTDLYYKTKESKKLREKFREKTNVDIVTYLRIPSNSH